MHLPRDRPTVQQAIEGLKIHKLRKENALIFDEISNIRKAAEKQELQLSNVLKEVTDLKSKVDEAKKSYHEGDEKLTSLARSINCTSNDVKLLQEDQKELDRRCIQNFELHQGAAKELRELVDKTSDLLINLQDHFEQFKTVQHDIVNQVQQDLVSKADCDTVNELRERLRQTLKEFQDWQKSSQGVSRVTDTFEHIEPAFLGSSATNNESLLSSFLQPIDLCEPRLSQESNVNSAKATTTNHNIQDNLVISTQIHPHSQVEMDTASSVCGMKAPKISNINHKTPYEVGHQRVRESRSQIEYVASLLEASPTLPQQNEPKVPAILGAGNGVPVQGSGIQPTLADPQTICEALRMLLELKQHQKDLTQYFEVFQPIFAALPRNEDVESICLMRFINGIAEDWEKAFVLEWLKSGQFTIQNARDCTVLLDHCLKHSPHTTGIGVLEKGDAVLSSSDMQESNKATDKMPHCSGQSSGKSLQAAMSRKRKNVGSRKQELVPNVITRAAWAAQRRATPTQDSNATTSEYAQTSPHSKQARDEKAETRLCISVSNRAVKNAVKNNKRGSAWAAVAVGHDLERTHEDRFSSRGSAIHAPRTPVKSKVTLMAPKRKRAAKTCLPRGKDERHVSSSPPTEHLIDTPSKVQRPSELIQDLAQELPALISFKIPPKVVVPETSDSICLPSIPRQVRWQKESSEARPRKKRRTKRYASPEIPVLSLTPGDVQD